MKVRQDAWTHEDDVLLAETVLRYIRDGGTQLAAFDEVSDQLNRTSAACGFRWNAEVRQNYHKAIALAKKQRKERKRIIASSSSVKQKQTVSHFAKESHPSAYSFQDIIHYLTTIQNDTETLQQAQLENKRLKEEQMDLQKRNKQLVEKATHLSQQQTTIHEEYAALLKIMEHARKAVLFDEKEPSPKQEFER
ncbi:RsfA family transcriptional regulator [Bacillus sp. CGMCC 1.16541]|uniref:RsfA family transcriptional regulator n=1 Tax=Bacillus sp. CGMCC 1.16541 TaxID=2185143 RepID=UPI000D72C9ED|nr:RsfA family transcriptional regulator [Bacillus sp. CGMCC 1.16541]